MKPDTICDTALVYIENGRWTIVVIGAGLTTQASVLVPELALAQLRASNWSDSSSMTTYCLTGNMNPWAKVLLGKHEGNKTHASAVHTLFVFVHQRLLLGQAGGVGGRVEPVAFVKIWMTCRRRMEEI